MEINLVHSTFARVRYADTDRMGYLYNGNYLAFFEVGRNEIMRQYGIRYRDLEDAGYLLPLRDAYARYISPAYFDDYLEIRTSLNFTGGPILKFDYEIYRDETKISEGFTSHMFVTRETRRVVKPPKIFLDSISSINL
ncbi:MAG: acyl-CoA thioesterase [Candidatus Kapabacteria bacterium]|nr:acyl-CoA thioesterase [Ignavibacteriota bacterium]MCW5884127.1 acyl-CoA thioesterase [Candidatus Kapabacteria bacterium]